MEIKSKLQTWSNSYKNNHFLWQCIASRYVLEYVTQILFDTLLKVHNVIYIIFNIMRIFLKDLWG